MRLDYTDYVGMAESIVSVVVGAVTLSRVAVEPSVSESIVGNAQRTVDILLQGAPTSPTLMKISGNKR
jgi:TetR/AcrR family transcriptional repressor of nem operon